MITIRPTVRPVVEGFVPALTACNAAGRILGTYSPRGAAREWRTFTNERAALTEACVLARRAAERYPNGLTVEV